MLETVIVNSSTDPAGSTIHKELVEAFSFKETGDFYDGLPVYSNNGILLATTQKPIVNVGPEIDDYFEREKTYVFISRHAAESKIPSLTGHFTGNFGDDTFGGKPRQIARYCPNILKNYLKELDSFRKEIPQEYKITLEATHHGPTELVNPSMFVELGSTPERWEDRRAASFVASALIRSLLNEKVYSKCAIGVGGTHYSEKFNDLELETEIALGSIVPKYALQYFDQKMFDEIIGKSTQEVNLVVLDSKGLGKEKQRILELVTRSGLEILKI
ncbi:MAG: D-aminoacyl-tRNA deacylase [Nitrososphaerales archaeon]